MGTRHIFRLDDICETMNWDIFFMLKDVFIKNNVKPIIGVIPNNEDETLEKYPFCKFDFWEEIRTLQNIHGWSIALHGYDHRYLTTESGIFGINKKSEFAGLTKEAQCKKIKMGKKFFQQHEIKIDAFMAPAHSLDLITLECLIENGINVVTDGFGFYPYYKYGVLFVPQLFSKPRNTLFQGVYTWCLHTNLMSTKDIDDIEHFIKVHYNDIGEFHEASNFISEGSFIGVQRGIIKILINSARKLKKVI